MLAQYIYARRRWAKLALALIAKSLPPLLGRRVRAIAEQVAFRVVPQYQGDTLPAMFLHWAGRHVAPLLQPLGVASPEDLVFQQACRLGRDTPGGVAIVSFGSGGCEFEIRLAARLRQAGHACTVRCVDFNATLLASGRMRAALEGVDNCMAFHQADCNLPLALPPHDLIVINQFLHHVECLEVFCQSVRACLAPGGAIVTSDLVGRNGHRLWPDTERVVQEHWRSLPAARTYDRYFQRCMPRYVSVDHAAYSNEGIRAQEIVACLERHFAFEVFITFGAAVIPFVERRIGFNFLPDDDEDRRFIDAIAAVDADNIAARRYPAVNMIAVLRHAERAERAFFSPVSPREHIEMTRRQSELAAAAA